MIKDRIKKLRHYFNKYKIDGYVIPKNDEYFSEYSELIDLKPFQILVGQQVLQLS
jgi:Xaa-Pro aminopeptidase